MRGVKLAPFILPLVLSVFGLDASASPSLAHARQAQVLLGADTWSRLVEISNSSSSGVYPKKLAALVFEFGGLLWFYTDVDGTQSCSLQVGRLAEEKAGLGPLLEAIDPGFRRFRIVPPRTGGANQAADGALPNGCFIESVAALRRCVQRGELIDEARLLSFYARVGGVWRGHTVLVCRTPAGTFVVDSGGRAPRMRLAGGWMERAVAVAHAVRPDLADVKARWVPTTLPRDGRVAGTSRRDRPTGARLR